jgi:predicted kinase
MMTHKQKKAKLLLKNGTSFVINLTWLQRQKANAIRRHIYHAAKAKNLNVMKVKFMT